jgi:hypothetical protein
MKLKLFQKRSEEMFGLEMLFNNSNVINVVLVFILFLFMLAVLGYIIKYPKMVTKEQLTKMKNDGISNSRNKNYIMMNNRKNAIIKLVNVLNIAKEKKQKNYN